MSKKRSRADFEKGIRAIGNQQARADPETVYPQVVPARSKSKQYIDVVDEADERLQLQLNQQSCLTYRERRRIIELRFGKYGHVGETYAPMPIRRYADIAKAL